MAYSEGKKTREWKMCMLTHNFSFEGNLPLCVTYSNWLTYFYLGLPCDHKTKSKNNPSSSGLLYNTAIPKINQSGIWKIEWLCDHGPWTYWWALGKTIGMLLILYTVWMIMCEQEFIYSPNKWFTLGETFFFQIILLHQSRFSWHASTEWRFDIGRPAWGRRKGSSVFWEVSSVGFKLFYLSWKNFNLLGSDS